MPKWKHVLPVVVECWFRSQTMARLAGRLCTVGHRSNLATNIKQPSHHNQVRSSRKWRRIMKVDPAAMLAYSWLMMQHVGTIILSLFSNVYSLFMKKWNRGELESLELLGWLEQVSGSKYNTLEEVWTQGGRTISLLIQERTKEVTRFKMTNTMYLAQHLAVTQLGLAEVFNNQELLEEKLNKELEKKFRKFLKNIRNALNLLESVGSPGYRISEDLFARGIGLYAAYVGRRGVFSIYSKTGGPFEGTIIEMKGEGETAILVIGGEFFNGNICMEYKYRNDKVLVSYVVSKNGQFLLNISQNGFQIPGSPFEVHIETAPDGYNGKFGAAEWCEPPMKIFSKIHGEFKKDICDFDTIGMTDFSNSLPIQDSPIKKSLPSSPKNSVLTKRITCNSFGFANTQRLPDLAASLVLARKFTSKLKTPIKINLENFHYFDNLNPLPSNLKAISDFVGNDIPYDKFVLGSSGGKLQSCPNLMINEADKKVNPPDGEAEVFNVWPSMCAFGPPSLPESNPPSSNPISSNNSINTSHITTYISPDGAAFPISFNQNEESFDKSFKTITKNSDSYLFNNSNDSYLKNVNNNLSSRKTILINDWVDNSSQESKHSRSADNSLSTTDKSGGNDKLDSYSSEDCYKLPSKERVIEVALKSQYECTVFVPKNSPKQKYSASNDSFEKLPEKQNTNNETSSLPNKDEIKGINNFKKVNKKSKKRCTSVLSIFDMKRNHLKDKFDLRRTQSAFSRYNCKSVTSALSYIKSRKNVFIKIGEYAKGSKEVIKSSKSVKKWKNYWDGLQNEKNVYTVEGKNCSLELNGIVAQGKTLFENISQKNDQIHRALPAKVQEEIVVRMVEPSKIQTELDPECKKRFQEAKNLFVDLEKPKRIYRSLPSKLKQNQQGKKRRRTNSETYAPVRSLSERFHVVDFYKDIHEGLGAPGIPNRLAVLASFRSVEPREEIVDDLPGFSANYPHIPTTPQNKYKHRSNMETLIPWGQIVKVNS